MEILDLSSGCGGCTRLCEGRGPGSIPGGDMGELKVEGNPAVLQLPLPVRLSDRTLGLRFDYLFRRDIGRDAQQLCSRADEESAVGDGGRGDDAFADVVHGEFLVVRGVLQDGDIAILAREINFPVAEHG